jgi:ATP-binding cassette subfamily C protein LapB
LVNKGAKVEQKGDIVRFNALLESLVIMTKLFKRPFSAESLVAGLPIEEGKSTPELFSIAQAKSEFSRVAQRAGLRSSLVRKELEEISPLVLPVILVLKDNGACILTGFDAHKEHARIIIPELGETESWVSFEDLHAEFMGFAFYVKKEFEQETIEIEEEFHLPVHKRHWFWDTIKFSTNIYRDSIIASLLINFFVLATPLFTMNVYDRVVPNAATDTLWVLAIGVVIIFVFDTVLKFMRAYFLETAGKKNDVIMSSMLFERVMDIKMDVYPKSIGVFANHIKEFSAISSFFASATMSIVIDLPFVIIFLLTIYYIAGVIVLVPVITILLILIYSIFIRKPLQESIESTYESAAKKYGILIESLSTLETLKTLGSTGQTQWKWEENSGDMAKKGIRTRMLSSSIVTVTSLLIQVNIVSILIVGVYMIGNNELTMGGLIATVILASRAIAPMGQVAGLISNYEHVKTTYNVLEEIMHLPVERPEGKKFLSRPDFTGKVEFKNVSFSYAGCERNVLDGVSFTIEAGEKVALIGKIGSGKTTIEKMILGLYTATEGSILLDDVEITQLDPNDVRKNIGYVAQDVVLFKGTVKENIIYKEQDATDAQIIRAAEFGGVTSFVNRHPKGFDMEVGERGMGLSGGQRQSVALARSFLMDTPIYMFDEPTNSIDGSEEAKLVKRIKNGMKDKTVIMVTHKPALLDLVDRLIVLDEGKVVLDGEKSMVLKALNGA